MLKKTLMAAGRHGNEDEEANGGDVDGGDVDGGGGEEGGVGGRGAVPHSRSYKAQLQRSTDAK